jgi:serine/threonine-protein kinase HipA
VLSDLDTFKGLPGMLADVLPDKYGSQLINAWLAANGRPQNSLNPVELLCFMGTRGMGALEFEPAQVTENKRAFQIELESLVETAKQMLNEKVHFQSKLKSNDLQSMQDILRIGTSAGGARPKAVIAYNEKTGEVRSGQTKAPKGFEHWLIKLDGVSDVQLGQSKGYGRVEMAYYNMATDSGIDMMPSRLLEENGRAHFLTKRFDREGSEVKHHVQTFCAMNHFDFNDMNSFSYEQLFQTMRELRLTYAEAEQMFRRMVFNVLARNCDDHTKNFAFRLQQDGKWELAPAYDICHAYAPNHQWVSQHALSINGKRTAITRKDLLIVGESIRCKNAAHIIDHIQDVVQQWPNYAKAVGVSPKLRDAIYSTFELHY